METKIGAGKSRYQLKVAPAAAKMKKRKNMVLRIKPCEMTVHIMITMKKTVNQNSTRGTNQMPRESGPHYLYSQKVETHRHQASFLSSWVHSLLACSRTFFPPPPLALFPNPATVGVPVQPVLVKLPFKHHDVSPTPGTKKLSLLLRTLCQVGYDGQMIS